MAFHVKRTVPDSSSKALVSDCDEVDTAIVYVHGFMGDVDSTWEHLVYYVDRFQDQPFRRSDLYFFDYSAESNFVSASAKRLGTFLKQVFPLPQEDLLDVQLQDLDWRLPTDDSPIRLRVRQPYLRLILVGHSLGAVVIRRFVADEALSQSAEAGESQFLDSELFLMAPAHLGYQPAGIKALISSIPFSVSLHHIAAIFRGFTDLGTDCFTLAQLHRETQAMAAAFPGRNAFRPRIVFGEREDVVVVGRFDSDSPSDVQFVANKNHVTVCKVDANYLVPTECVMDRGMKRGA